MQVISHVLSQANETAISFIVQKFLAREKTSRGRESIILTMGGRRRRKLGAFKHFQMMLRSHPPLYRQYITQILLLVMVGRAGRSGLAWAWLECYAHAEWKFVSPESPIKLIKHQSVEQRSITQEIPR